MVRAKMYTDVEIAALAQAFTRTIANPEIGANLQRLESFVADFLERLEQLAPVGVVPSDGASWKWTGWQKCRVFMNSRLNHLSLYS
jgi:hypothetical protein